MALTLEEAKVGMADKVDQNVIDEFRRASLLLDMLIFDDTVSPGNRWFHTYLWLREVKNSIDGSRAFYQYGICT